MAVRIRAKIKGLQKVMNNLNREVKKITFKSEKGLMIAGFFIKRKSQQNVPVDTGALKASAFVENISIFGKPAAMIGYTQSYAVFVHEIMTNYHKVGRAKYLENIVKENQNEILQIIRREAKIS